MNVRWVNQLRLYALALALASLACAGGAAGPGAGAPAPAKNGPPPGPDAVRTIDLYVLPYYESAKAPGKRPTVRVGKDFDALLSSNRPEDVLAARDRLEADPDYITPMTMTVLAVRLYDAGYRDDAVFWFYAARNRYHTLEGVLELAAPETAGVRDAMHAFYELAGPVINGYAYCDLAKLKGVRARSLAWVEQHPYAALFWDRLPARPGDRGGHLKETVAALRGQLREELEFLGREENVARLRELRAKNGVDARYCWQ